MIPTAMRAGLHATGRRQSLPFARHFAARGMDLPQIDGRSPHQRSHCRKLLSRRNESLKPTHKKTVGALTIAKTSAPKPVPESEGLAFGKVFSDHMLHVDWDADAGWHAPRIEPFGDLPLSPAAMTLHYAVQCFEGMKAYKDASGKIRLFRPDLNMERYKVKICPSPRWTAP
jgi:branched-chain amino acid aminotransferase